MKKRTYCRVQCSAILTLDYDRKKLWYGAFGALNSTTSLSSQFLKYHIFEGLGFVYHNRQSYFQSLSR